MGFQYVLIDFVYRFAIVKYNSKTKTFFNLQFKSNSIGRLDVAKHPELSMKFRKFPPSLHSVVDATYNWKSISSEISIERGKKW